jgi:hypothetical protein
MKKLLVTLCVMSALAIAAHAEDSAEAKKPEATKPEVKKREMSAEQKAVMKEIKEKYDTNKDGKLDKEERAKISAEDKAKLEKAGLPMGRKKKAE